MEHSILFDLAYWIVIVGVPFLLWFEFDQWRMSKFSNDWWRHKLMRLDIRIDELNKRIDDLEKDRIQKP